MERPSLHPSHHLELEAPPPAAPSVFRRLLRGSRWVVNLLLTPLPGSRVREGEEHSVLVRLGRGLVYRLAAVPLVLGLVVGVLVYAGTNPIDTSAGATRADPSSLGLYFETVSVRSSDGVVSRAWLVPTLDARRVLEDKDAVLTRRSVAVVLLHDQASGPAEWLPMLRPLNDAGVVTLTVALRGRGTGGARGATFGLRESLDAAGAVEFLRGRSTIDPDRIAVLGRGTGATAALMAARRDRSLRVAAAVSPPEDADELLATLYPPQTYLKFLRPLTRWTFESAFDVDADDARLDRLTAQLREREVLYLLADQPGHSSAAQGKTLTHFLASRLASDPASAHVEIR